MQEMYDNFQEGEEWDLPPEKDPFVDDYESEFHIGSVKIWLKSLAYMIETKEQLEITNFSGQAVGLLNIEILPCDANGKPYTDEDDKFVEDPELLRGQPLYCLVKIVSARGLPNKFTLLDYLQEGAIMVQIWGKQKPPKEKKKVTNTRLANLADARTKGEASVANTNVKRFDSEKMKYMMESAMLKKRQEKIESKLRHMRQMLEKAEEHKKKKLSVKLIGDIYHAPTEDAAQKCIAMIPMEKGSMNYLRLVTRYARLVMNDARLVICDARLVICDARLVMRYPRLVMGYPRLIMRYPRLVMGYRDN
nr:hypothetical protein BaRGS_028274 [Batillaria attramentaria]